MLKGTNSNSTTLFLFLVAMLIAQQTLIKLNSNILFLLIPLTDYNILKPRSRSEKGPPGFQPRLKSTKTGFN